MSVMKFSTFLAFISWSGLDCGSCWLDQLFLNALAKFLLTIFGMIIIYTIGKQLSQGFQALLGFVTSPSVRFNRSEALA